MPGLVNTHTHAAMTLMRGLSDDVPLEVWLKKYIWPAEARYINKETVRIGTELAVLEMIRSGTTTMNDLYFFMDEVGQVVEKAGTRAVIAESLIDFPTPNGKTPDEGMAYTRKLIQKWKGHSRVTVAIGAHAPYTCSPALLRSAWKLARRHGLMFHIHLSETQTEVKTIFEKYGFTPTGHLHNLGVLGDRLIAAHAVHLSEEDRALIARFRVGVAHNPESNMKLASGAAPVPQLLQITPELGLATDGAASNNDLDMFEAMDMAAKLQKFAHGNPGAVDAETVVRMATIGGARVLGLGDEIGSLEPGKRADLILIPLDKPHLTPFYNPYSHIVYAVSGADVSTVIVDGRILMENRRLLTLDEGTVLERARRVGATIRAAFRDNPGGN